MGEQIPNVDRVVVYKKKRVLQLCRGDSVLKQYPIALGKSPEGHKVR
ncbi:MAG: L,D-transpeptidase, partial [Gemmatimonadetes bacterium]|nr:L,D-transpeptidase [Gemmatimonadota bacterium]